MKSKPEQASLGFRPLAGCGLFPLFECKSLKAAVSVPLRGVGCFDSVTWDKFSALGFRPLAGCGLFLAHRMRTLKPRRFPSPCGVWVVSARSLNLMAILTVSVPLRGVGCFGKAAHSFWCNRKKNCQLCYFIVSYWQMFINSKLRNCKVPCEAHKTAT